MERGIVAKIKALRNAFQANGIDIRLDRESGEIEVSIAGRPETVYFATDVEDARQTAEAMSKHSEVK